MFYAIYMAILLNNNGFDNQAWAQALARLLPAMPVYIYPDVPASEQIHYALVWNHPHGDLRNYPNLRAVLLLGAGTDHIDQEPQDLGVPIVRLIDPDVGNDMSQYTLYWVMHFQRGYEAYRQRASQKIWQGHQPTRSLEYCVTVLGQGRIGQFIAKQLAAVGFKTQAWSRHLYSVDGVESFAGDEGLHQALNNTDCLVNCLPLVAGTEHFLNQARLTQLPHGASLINVSRGAVIDDQALLDLLNDGHICQAALDTFALEPLPQDSPYWSMPNVFVTPHISGATYAEVAATAIVDNIQRMEHGDAPFPIHIK